MAYKKSRFVALVDGEKQERTQIHIFFDFMTLGLVNLEISRFSVDNDDRQVDRLLYPLCMCAGNNINGKSRGLSIYFSIENDAKVSPSKFLSRPTYWKEVDAC